ncbi:VRR-NUC domain-containing protein [Acinetobacter pittii]|uniref:VRR-NUC domain-containing protein n=1 Tax=Acinetobacter pittii TaxID=48296 RepID=UPI0021CDE6F1|nr:VRR-NUC domain-containing protein [Acinetobacter pittii]MCU4334776.1 VRR-NUC domain-containing protein [Acinetobacter pittii]
MSFTKRGKGRRPASVEELFKATGKNNKGVKKSISLSNNTKKDPKNAKASLVGLALDKPRKPSKEEQNRRLLGLEPSEDESQMCIMDWAKLQRWKKGTLADYLHHSPNGGLRSKSEAGKFKKMGTKAGFPDLFLPIAMGPFNGLFIEMKISTGKISVSQKAYIPLLVDEGYRVEVCYSAEGAINLIKSYLELE